MPVMSKTSIDALSTGRVLLARAGFGDLALEPNSRCTAPLVALTMAPPSHPLRFVLIVLAGWMNQQQREVIDYLQEENRVRESRC
jgi:hypothetical protein